MSLPHKKKGKLLKRLVDAVIENLKVGLMKEDTKEPRKMEDNDLLWRPLKGKRRKKKLHSRESG